MNREFVQFLDQELKILREQAVDSPRPIQLWPSASAASWKTRSIR